MLLIKTLTDALTNEVSSMQFNKISLF